MHSGFATAWLLNLEHNLNNVLSNRGNSQLWNALEDVAKRLRRSRDHLLEDFRVRGLVKGRGGDEHYFDYAVMWKALWIRPPAGSSGRPVSAQNLLSQATHQLQRSGGVQGSGAHLDRQHQVAAGEQRIAYIVFCGEVAELLFKSRDREERPDIDVLIDAIKDTKMEHHGKYYQMSTFRFLRHAIKLASSKSHIRFPACELEPDLWTFLLKYEGGAVDTARELDLLEFAKAEKFVLSMRTCIPSYCLCDLLSWLCLADLSDRPCQRKHRRR